MNIRKCFALVLFVALGLVFAASNRPVVAQSADGPAQSEKRGDETNLDTQLYLLIATNQEVDDTKLPAAVESVVKQLRASLGFKNYRLAATLVNRVRNEGRLQLNWVGGPLLASAKPSETTPTFNDFKIDFVRLVRDAEGQQLIRMQGFRFGARVPIQISSTVASNAPAVPVVHYENTGLNTDFSMREGEPVVVGTLHLGPSGDAIILVMTARRSGR